MKVYCVVYKVFGIHYRYRCTAKTKKEARKLCHDNMACTYSNIVEIYED